MRALSLWRPWPALIAVYHPLAKRIENRSWDTGYRGEFAVHAGKKWDPDAREMAAWAGLPDNCISWNPDDHPTGIVAVAGLIGVCGATVGSGRRPCGCGKWAVDEQYHWHLSPMVQVLAEVVPGPGRQGWWQVDPDRTAAVERQLHRAGVVDCGSCGWPQPVEAGAEKVSCGNCGATLGAAA